MPQATELVSKIQYNGFEPGEFVSEKKRSCQEIIALIENFPWEQQREKIHIGLTGPAVVIQTVDSYLKLAVYYNHKFILYYYDGRNLYSKSLVRYQQASEDIEEYFNTGTANIPDFKREPTMFKPVRIHFVTDNFIYKVDGSKPFKYISPFTILGILFYLAVLIFLFTMIPAMPRLTFLAIFTLIMGFIAFGPVNLILSLNYLVFCRDKMLQLSRGAEDFKYGDISNPRTFKKSDVERILVKRNTNSRCAWGNYAVSHIHMKDGSILTVPSTLLPSGDIENKMPHAVIRTESVFIPTTGKSE